MGLGNVRYARLQRSRLSSHPGQLLVRLCLNGSIMAPLSWPLLQRGNLCNTATLLTVYT
jgi:hypothetical protein